MTPRFEQAFIQCLKDGVYPGPANLNERFRADKKRINKLNGQYTKMRLALMYEFAVPYQRGNPIDWDANRSYMPTLYNAGSVPEWPHLHNQLLDFETSDYPSPPVMGNRKAEIQNPDEPWKLRRK